MSTYFADPDYDRMLDAQAEAWACERDSYEEFCQETGRDPEAEEENAEAWESFKESCARQDMELSFAQEQQERMEMGDEWYE